MQETADSNC